MVVARVLIATPRVLAIVSSASRKASHQHQARWVRYGRSAANTWAARLGAVSKAFTKDDDAGTPQFVRSRPPVPQGTPNYVTPRGLAALRAEHVRLEEQRARWEAAGDTAAAGAISARIVELDARIGSAVVVASPAAGQARETVRFGASVAVVGEGGVERHFQIVGVDEADAAAGRIAFTAPLARALLGRRVGDLAEVDTVHGEETWSIRAIGYDALDQE
jgi:transcription elongation factor GreB